MGLRPPLAQDSALQLRRDFAVNPSMSASSLGTKINAAVQSAISAGRSLSLGYEMWPVDVPILINGPLTLMGDGVRDRFDSLDVLSNNLAYNVPTKGNHIEGAGIIQTSAATDAIRISVVGEAVSLIGFGIRFDGAHRFLNTGHGVNVLKTASGQGAFDHGPISGTVHGLSVYGHDGNHYALEWWNSMLYRFDKIRSYGGGGLHFAANSPVFYYGNLACTDFYTAVFVGGSAHGIYLDNQDSTHFMDYMTFDRAQTWTIVPTVPIGGGVAVVTTAQKNVTYNSAGVYRYIKFHGPDPESSLVGGYFEGAFNMPPGEGNSFDSLGHSAVPDAAHRSMLSAPVSGTVYRNDLGSAVVYAIGATMNPTGVAAAVLTLQIAKDSGFTQDVFTVSRATVPAAGPTGIEMTCQAHIASGHYFKYTLTNGTRTVTTSYLIGMPYNPQ